LGFEVIDVHSPEYAFERVSPTSIDAYEFDADPALPFGNEPRLNVSSHDSVVRALGWRVR
jgi:hypothetical protein